MASTTRPRRFRLVLGMVAGAVVLLWLASLAGVVLAAGRDTARPAQAIVVMGAAQYVGRPSPVLRARLDHAIALWKRGLAPWLIVTGGVGVGDTTSEAAVARRYAIARGVDPRAILLERRGRTTSESLHGVAEIMERFPARTAIFVSDPFHMLRLSIVSKRLGLVPYTSPTRTSPISENRTERWKYVLAESVKVPLAYIMEATQP